MPKFINDSLERNAAQRLENTINRELGVDLDPLTYQSYPDDMTDQLFEHGLKIQIYHIPSRTEVAFKAWITDFTDKYEQEWSEDSVFGRNDNHQVFKGTRRNITMSWKVLAGDIREAKENMKKLSLLAQMQYPTYNASVQGEDNIGRLNANAIQASPVFKLKFLNWVTDASAGRSPNSTARDSGLPGKMGGFEFDPDFAAGIFHDRDGSIYAQESTISLQFTAIHTHNLGWQGRGSRQPSFPYGEDLSQESSRGRSAIRKARPIRNSSGATEEQREAKQNQILHNMNAGVQAIQ